MRIEGVSKECDNHMVGIFFKKIILITFFFQEEDTIDAKSTNFRLRGLRPNCTYRLSLKNQELQNSYPPFLDIITNNQDINDLSFILTPSKETNTFFGKVLFEEGLKAPQNLRLSLFKENSLLQDIHLKDDVTIFTLNDLIERNSVIFYFFN